MDTLGGLLEGVGHLCVGHKGKVQAQQNIANSDTNGVSNNSLVTHSIFALPCQKFPGKNLPPESC